MGLNNEKVPFCLLVVCVSLYIYTMCWYVALGVTELKRPGTVQDTNVHTSSPRRHDIQDRQGTLCPEFHDQALAALGHERILF